MSDRPRVLITNAEERSMLAVCRSLHAAGYEVTAASSTRLAAAQWSRSCARRLRLVDARVNSSAFVEQLCDELKRRSYDTLIAGSDSSLLAISNLREQIEPLTTLGLPAPSIVERSMRRETLAQAAREVGLPIPATTRCATGEQALAAAGELGFPVVIKSVDAAIGGASAVASMPKGQVVFTPDELASAASQFRDGMLIQRRVRGDLISLGGAFADERLLGAVTSLYERMWPPDSGSVTFSETIPPPSGLVDAVQELTAVIGWEGIFELELIRSGTDELYPIDFNPRPYGSMALSEGAGVPLAAIWCDWLLGRATSSTRRYTKSPTREPTEPALAPAGRRYRWEDGDLRHVVWQLRRRCLGAALRPLRPHRRVTHAHFRWTDPLPFLARTLHLGARFITER